jgi:hypothetical protein
MELETIRDLLGAVDEILLSSILSYPRRGSCASKRR